MFEFKYSENVKLSHVNEAILIRNAVVEDPNQILNEILFK